MFEVNLKKQFDHTNTHIGFLYLESCSIKSKELHNLYYVPLDLLTYFLCLFLILSSHSYPIYKLLRTMNTISIKIEPVY
jgi:hypothetical protein